MGEIRFDAVRAWLFGQALPFWAEHGLDAPGRGFLEQLTLDGRPKDPGFKRLRTQARQVYAFSHAELLGWDGPARDRADAGWRFLLSTEFSDGGFPKTLNADGSVQDPAFDLYDQAFAIYASAWRRKATGEAEAEVVAHRTLVAVERRLGRADRLGFRACDPDPGELVQNPHMHLLEASLAWVEATDDPRFRDLAGRILDLCLQRFMEADTGVLAEHFDAGWRPVAGQRGRLVEPGHQYEWAWLLGRAQVLLGRDLETPARALHGFAAHHGHNPQTRLCWDCVDADSGRPLKATSRSWAQTEALKAELALGEHWGVFNPARIAEAVDLLLDRHLAWEPAGTWMDCFDAEGRPIADHIPASILYHVLLAFAELLRLQPRIQAGLLRS